MSYTICAVGHFAINVKNIIDDKSFNSCCWKLTNNFIEPEKNIDYFKILENEVLQKTNYTLTKKIKELIQGCMDYHTSYMLDGDHFCDEHCDLKCSEKIVDIVKRNDNNYLYYHEVSIKKIIEMMKKRGYLLNGRVIWRGESFTDTGEIIIKNNILTVKWMKFTDEFTYNI